MDAAGARPRWRIGRSSIAIALRLAKQSIASGKLKRALLILGGLVEISPETVIARLLLARVALEAGDDDAFASIVSGNVLRGLLRRPSQYSYVLRLLLAQEEFDGAEDYLKEALERFPEHAAFLGVAGELSHLRGDTSQAVTYFERQFELSSMEHQKLNALKSIMRVNSIVGRKRAADSLIPTMQELNPNCGWTYHYIVDSDRGIDASHPAVARMRELLESPDTLPGDRMLLHYTVGLALHRTGKVGGAFAHFFQGNKLRATRFPPFDLQAFSAMNEQRREVFTSKMIASMSRHGCQQPFLICIVGMPRSGTTLTEQILASHSGIVGLGERTEFHKAARQLSFVLNVTDAYPKCCSRITPEVVSNLACKVKKNLTRWAGAFSRVVTKLPDDCFDVGFIKTLFPMAKIIYCKRDMRDTCLSNFMQPFEGLPYTTDLENLRAVYKEHELMMKHWDSVLDKNSIFTLSYESVVSDPVNTIVELCNFCGIQYDGKCLKFYENQRKVETASMWQVRQPIYASSVGQGERYREYLSALGCTEGDC